MSYITRLRNFVLVLFLTGAASVAAQQLKGTVRDNEGEIIPAAAIYIKETMTGTSTNDRGEYQIRLQDGINHIIFQALGFQSTEIEIKGGTTVILRDITLNRRPVTIREVRVYPGSEDAAYPIMRKAIASAPAHIREVERYNSEVYLKGTINFRKIPRIIANRIEVNGQKIKSGDVFSMESVNEISFSAPDKYEHKVKSLRSTFPSGTGNDDDYIGYIGSSFYQPTIGITISPLSPSAFSHYRFVYEEFFVEQGMEINRIKVIPRRKSQQLFAGYINIVDKSWSIQSVDLTNETFFGKINVKQTYAPVKDQVWLPVNHNFTVEGSGIGMKISGSYIGSVKYKTVTLSKSKNESPSGNTVPIKNENDTNLQSKEKKSAGNMQKIKELMEKPDINKSDMTKIVRLMEKQQRLEDTTANNRIITDKYKVTKEKDTIRRTETDWDMMRPVPLSAEEVRSFQKRDSVMMTMKVQKKDSISTNKQRNYVSNILFGTRNQNWGENKSRFEYKGLLNPGNLSFHPVTGFNYAQTVSCRIAIDSAKAITFGTTADYSFSSEKISWKAHANIGNMKKGIWSISAGHYYDDMKEIIGANTTANSLYNLLMKDNYKILTRQHIMSMAYNRSIADGLSIHTSATYTHNIGQQNHTNFSFFNRDENYMPNIPTNPIVDEKQWNTGSQAYLSATISYTPYMKYRIVGKTRVPAGSDYPTINLNYRKGIKSLWNSQSDYSFAGITVNHSHRWGVFYNLNWKIDAGIFTNAKNIHFTRWKHFEGDNMPLAINKQNWYIAGVNPYLLSTNKRYISASVNYSSPLLVLKYLPLLSNTLWNEDLIANHVSTPAMSYTEVGYGLSKIFVVGKIAVIVCFDGTKYKNIVVRAAIGF